MKEQTDIVVFGAVGDLAVRKLFPALYQLHRCGLLEDDLKIISVARPEFEREAYVANLSESVSDYIDERYKDESALESFFARFDYSSADFSEVQHYSDLADKLSEARTSIFYLATPPSLFDDICKNLHDGGCLNGQTRIVFEKPIGHDFESCVKVNETAAKYFDEEDIYRIDHYLGKETVQNLLVLRFANRFINAQWDQSCIDHVQITVAELVGIEGRWSYYDTVGQLRDMVQNHLMQLLCLVAMEPPNSMTAESIREEKVKILRALRRIDTSAVEEHAVRGQYTAGWSKDNTVPGYMEEEGCQSSSSATETFVAIKAHIDNWRWAGVPFYLRTGKRMTDKITEIVISYKSLPHNIFSDGQNIPNRLVIRLQPNEGIEMQMVSKVHTLKNKMELARKTLNLDFLGSSGMDRIPSAYERLFLDVIAGDPSLFVGKEEVEESWRWCDALIDAWTTQALEVKAYHAGSMGPSKADMLIEKDGRSWHEQ